MANGNWYFHILVSWGLLLFFGAFVVLRLKKVLPISFKWVAPVLTIGLFLAASVQTYFLSEVDFEAKGIFANWVRSLGLETSLRIGVFADGYQVVMGLAGAYLALLTFVFLRNKGTFGENAQVHSGILLGLSGVVVAWSSSTLWGGFFGILLGFVGAILLIGVDFENYRQTDGLALFPGYVWQSFSFLLVALLAGAILAATGSTLDFLGAESWGVSREVTIGAVLLFVSLLFVLKPIPFHGSPFPDAAFRQRGIFPAVVLIGVLFPAWAVYAVLLRLHEPFTSVELYPVMGWVPLGLLLLLSVVGIFQRNSKRALLILAVTLTLLSVTVLVWGGALAGFPVLLGTSFGVLILALLEDLSGRAKPKIKKGHPEAGLQEVPRIFAILAGFWVTGAVGTIVYYGLSHWLTLQPETPVVIAAFTILFFVFVFCWKTAWNLYQRGSFWGVEIWDILLISALFVGGLSVFWSGSLSGAASDEIRAQVLPSFLEKIHHAYFKKDLLRDPQNVTAEGILSALSFLSCLAAYLLQAVWDGLYRGLGRFSAWTEEFFFIERVLARVFQGSVSLLGKFEEKFTYFFWTNGFLRAFNTLLTRTSRVLSLLDEYLRDDLNAAIFEIAQVPSKTLQAVQNGNGQWYLFFGLSVGLAVILHFLIH